MAPRPHVFKFGGAALCSVEHLQRVVKIIQQTDLAQPLIIAVSATGKTTTQLAKLFAQHQQGQNNASAWSQLKQAHLDLSRGLPIALQEQAVETITVWHQALHDILKTAQKQQWSYEQSIAHFLGQGEQIASKILSYYLQAARLSHQWCDARQYVKTCHGFQSATLDWAATLQQIRARIPRLWQTSPIILTQGFIASNALGQTTTLGFEGSDFTGAILAAAVQATKLTLWKDVPGIMNADPKQIPKATVLPKLAYTQAATLMGHGAKVVHQHAISILSEAGIPLFIKSFLAPEAPGTVIGHHPPEEVAPITWAVVHTPLELVTFTPHDTIQICPSTPLQALLGRDQCLLQWESYHHHRYYLGFLVTHPPILHGTLENLASYGTITVLGEADLLTTQHDTEEQLAQQVLCNHDIYSVRWLDSATRQVLYGKSKIDLSSIRPR